MSAAALFRNLLVGLMALRLLVPPGLCLCHLCEPAPPAGAPAVADDHHHPGCPSSPRAGTAWTPKCENPPAPAVTGLLGPMPLPRGPEACPVTLASWSALDPPGAPARLALRI